MTRRRGATAMPGSGDAEVPHDQRRRKVPQTGTKKSRGTTVDRVVLCRQRELPPCRTGGSGWVLVGLSSPHEKIFVFRRASADDVFRPPGGCWWVFRGPRELLVSLALRPEFFESPETGHPPRPTNTHQESVLRRGLNPHGRSQPVRQAVAEALRAMPIDSPRDAIRAIGLAVREVRV